MCILHFSRSPLADHVFKAAEEAEKWPFFPGPVLGRGRGCLDRITITAGSLFIIFRPRGAQALKSSCTGGCRGRWSGRVHPGSSQATWSQSPLLTQPHAACWLAASSTGRETQHPTRPPPSPWGTQSRPPALGLLRTAPAPAPPPARRLPRARRVPSTTQPRRTAPAPNQLSSFCSAPVFALLLGWEEEVEPQKEPLRRAILCSPEHHVADSMGAATILVLPLPGRGGSDILPLLVKPFSFLYTHLLLLLCLLQASLEDCDSDLRLP